MPGYKDKAGKISNLKDLSIFLSHNYFSFPYILHISTTLIYIGNLTTKCSQIQRWIHTIFTHFNYNVWFLISISVKYHLKFLYFYIFCVHTRFRIFFWKHKLSLPIETDKMLNLLAVPKHISLVSGYSSWDPNKEEIRLLYFKRWLDEYVINWQRITCVGFWWQRAYITTKETLYYLDVRVLFGEIC